MTDRVKLYFILSLGLILFFFAGSYGTYRFIKHKNLQSEEIQRINQQVEELTNQIDELQRSSITWGNHGINYLAIGNSITSHPIADYWWNDGVGMAVSCEKNDYVHQISKWLKDNYNESVETYAYNFYNWEVQANDRAETLQLLDK